MTYDVAIVGAGIVGLAHAWMAARRGLKVALFERTRVAEGASVRNFGMIWPIGQPAGELHALALRSRKYWNELGSKGVVNVQACGSIHLAHHDDELQVLQEFQDLGYYDVELLSPEAVLARAPLANPEGLLGGMFSETELRVNPRLASASIAEWLERQYGVHCFFSTQITRAESNELRASDGRRWNSKRIIICSGSDLQTLFPEVLAESGLVLCKLQMLKSVSQSSDFRQEVHLASGLTLRHYAAFQSCPSLLNVKERVSRESPELDRFGIHVMASQLPDGHVILGDSHEYGHEISPFDKTEIEELMLRELKKVFRLQDWTIQERWHGIYAKHVRVPVFETEQDGVQVFVGTGGAGMTMAFGLAERAWKIWSGESS